MRTPLLVAVLAATLLLSSLAGAQERLSEYGYYTMRDRKTPESPQNVAMELRIGRYVPSVDSEFSGPGPGPYEYMFGTDTRFSFGLEFDYQALRIPYLGTLGPGIGVAYTKSSAAAFQTDSGDTIRGAEKTSLTIYPMYVVAVLRLDYLARETPVPLVPYGKLGLGFAMWNVNAGDHTAEVNGEKGSGISYGPQFALGGMFLLDAIDRGAANELDSNTGVNNSYLFAEWYVSHLDGFGSGNQMNVGTNTWVLGLAMEM
jgi:hypothetical protein